MSEQGSVYQEIWPYTQALAGRAAGPWPYREGRRDAELHDEGLAHVTAVATDPQRNADFYHLVWVAGQDDG